MLLILALETSIFSCVKRRCKACMIKLWFTKKRHIKRATGVKLVDLTKNVWNFITEMPQGTGTQQRGSPAFTDAPSY